MVWPFNLREKQIVGRTTEHKFVLNVSTTTISKALAAKFKINVEKKSLMTEIIVVFTI